MSFHFPYLYNSYFPNNFNNYRNSSIPYNPQNSNSKIHSKPQNIGSFDSNNTSNSTSNTKDCKIVKSTKEDDNCFFEIFGLKLQFDDILLIVLLFFLYSEGIKDEELFIVLILLLLS